MTRVNKAETWTTRIRDIPDFPKPGIVFKDIAPVLGDVRAFNQTIELLGEALAVFEFDYVVGIESRGFLIGAPLALRTQRGFIPVRKPGKLPAASWRVDYALEYGTDALEMHQDALKPGDRVVIVDDLLATGGTAEAARRLVDIAGATAVAAAFLIELEALGGRMRLPELPIVTLLRG